MQLIHLYRKIDKSRHTPHYFTLLEVDGTINKKCLEYGLKWLYFGQF